MYRYVLIALFFAILQLSNFIFPDLVTTGLNVLGQQLREYTVDEIMTAYDKGQYRIIETSSTNLILSPNKLYINALGDGVYRISDGTMIGAYDSARFSPNGLYIAQDGEGIYRLSDGEMVVSASPDTRDLEMVFSSTDQYIIINRDGVYHLNTGEKILNILEDDAHFSPDGQMISTSNGIFRLNDGEPLNPNAGRYPYFSPDSHYIVTDNGLFRLIDGTKITEAYIQSFSPDMLYAVAPTEGVYRLSDGQKLYGLSGPLPLNAPFYSSDNQYIAIEGNGVYRLHDGMKITDMKDVMVNVAFSPDSTLIAISGDGIYRLSDMFKLFPLEGGVAEFSPNGSYLGIDVGILRISDGQTLFHDKSGFYAIFSPDGEHIAFSDGIYRFSDEQKVFDLDGWVRSFTLDGKYINTGYAGEQYSIYRISDGYQYPNLRLMDISKGILAIENKILIIDSLNIQ